MSPPKDPTPNNTLNNLLTIRDNYEAKYYGPWVDPFSEPPPSGLNVTTPSSQATTTPDPRLLAIPSSYNEIDFGVLSPWSTPKPAGLGTRKWTEDDGVKSTPVVAELAKANTDTSNSLPPNPYDNTQAPSDKTQQSFDKERFYALGNHPHQYLLELYKEGGTKADLSVNLPFVSSIEMDQPNAVTRTWTFGGTPYEEHSGFKQRTFRIRGRSGYTTTQLSKFAALRNLLESYAYAASTTMNAFYRATPDKRTKLIFQALWEGEAWESTVASFRYQRDSGSSRVSYNYELLIVTNAVPARQWDPDNAFKGQEGGAARDQAHDAPSHDCYYYALKTTLTAEPEITRSTVAKEILKVHEYIRSIPNRTIFDWYFWYRLYHLCKETQASITSYRKTLTVSQAAAWKGALDSFFRWVLDLGIQCEVFIGRMNFDVPVLKADDVPANASNVTASRPLPNNGVPVRSIVVSQGQTNAFDVAAQYLGSRNLWARVVELNRMQDARTKGDGTPLVAGDRILIPSISGMRDIDPDTFYGRNLLFRGGDLVAVGDGTDIALISGLENFYQNFRHRMLTALGENRSYPRFGLPKLVGGAGGSDLAGQVYSNILNQTLSDHRVSRVTEMNMTTEAGNIDVKMAIITALQEKTRTGVSYPF